jgi:ParB-like chromosome segregation protein Spo0J
MKTLTIDKVTYTCPFSDLMPPLTAEERTELKADIEKNGVLCDVIVTDENEVIDGHHRLALAIELGLTAAPMKVVTGLTADEKQRRAENLNLHRRHLAQEQKQAIIVRQLQADPSRSNNAIA